MITIRHMASSELARIGEIDRSEHVTQEYVHRDGRLSKRSVEITAPAWSRTGDYEDSLRGRIDAWQPILDRGGTLVGAFDAERLVGFAIYRPHLAEGVGNLSALYVSRDYRRRGVAAQLTGEVARLARTDGARRLYVSATPSAPTVEFYLGRGFAPTDEPNEELFRLEPDDIHMVVEL